MRLLTLCSIFLFITFVNAKDDVLKIGIYHIGIFASKKEAQVASKIWNSKVNKDNNYRKDVQLILYDDYEEIKQKYLNKEISTMIINTNKYYKDKKTIDEVTFRKWVFIRNKDIFSNFYLIKNSTFDTKLSNKQEIEILYKEETAKNWAEYYLNKYPSLKINFKKIEKDNKLVFNVFFNDTYSVVRKELYSSLANLNPQIKNKVEIIEKSKQIFPMSIGVDRKDKFEKDSDIYDNILKDINENNIEFESFKHLDVKGIIIVNDKQLKPLDDFYEDYFKIIE